MRLYRNFLPNTSVSAPSGTRKTASKMSIVPHGFTIVYGFPPRSLAFTQAQADLTTTYLQVNAKSNECGAGGLPPLPRWQKPPSGTRKNIPRLSPSKFLRHFAGTPWTLSCVWFQKTIQMQCRWFATSFEVAKTAFGHSQKHTAALLCISRLRRFFRRAPSLLRKRKRRRRRKHLTVTK